MDRDCNVAYVCYYGKLLLPQYCRSVQFLAGKPCFLVDQDIAVAIICHLLNNDFG